jgi:hypothetical protein
MTRPDSRGYKPRSIIFWVNLSVSLEPGWRQAFDMGRQARQCQVYREHRRTSWGVAATNRISTHLTTMLQSRALETAGQFAHSRAALASRNEMYQAVCIPPTSSRRVERLTSMSVLPAGAHGRVDALINESAHVLLNLRYAGRSMRHSVQRHHTNLWRCT